MSEGIKQNGLIKPYTDEQLLRFKKEELKSLDKLLTEGVLKGNELDRAKGRYLNLHAELTKQAV